MKNEIEYPFQFYLRIIAHNIKRSIDKHLKPYGIGNQQARIIGFIYEKQKQGVSLCQKDIEAWIGITGASVTSLLQGLEKKGFIKRITGVKDERTKELILTVKGKELIDTLIAIFHDTEKKIIQGMTEEQKNFTLQLLRLINEKFETI